MPLRFQHATPAFRTFCGADALAALPRELDRNRTTRAVIFCGTWLPDLHRAALDRIEAALGDRLVARFDGVEEHSPVPAVETGRRVLEEAAADAVIAVGGGSSIVTARAATILLAEGKEASELCTHRSPDGQLVSPKLLEPKLPQWVIPTTPITAYAKAGSAVRDPQTGDRLALFDPKTRAQGIFIDPQLSLTAPVELAQTSAMNVFSMAVEALQADVDDPLADALLSQALRMAAEWLPRLIEAPDDPEPRMRLMLAALLCGQGTDYVGGGLAQALSHAAGPRSSTSNSTVEALLLPHTMRYNAPVVGERLAAVATALGARVGADLTPSAVAIDAVEDVLGSVGVPTRLRDVGIGLDDLGEVVSHAMDDWSITRIPRSVTQGDLQELLLAAW
ncbi:MAG: iron-containing alcohol dehydrogenase family protein [Solirubrobacteraceae bacterium]